MRTKTVITLVFACVATPRVSAQLLAVGQSLTVTTNNAIATFAGADLVGFRNLATGESYLKNPTAGSLAWVDLINPTNQTFVASNWTIGTDAGGAPLATINVQDTIRTLTLQVKIDANTQEIAIAMSARSSYQGLRGADWGIAGLDLSGGRLVVPASGGITFDAAHPAVGTYLEYPYNWHAQMAVYETTSGSGSFVIYATDSHYAFKQLQTTSRGNSTLDVVLGTEAVAPFATAINVPTVEWRVKAFAGNWHVAAQAYKDWLAVNRPPVSNAAYSWVLNIRTVAGLRPIDLTLVDQLATIFNPPETLLYLVDWRQDPYDYNYPDYTPAAGVADLVNHAHALGFKVMLHLDMLGVTPTNADYSTVSTYQLKKPDTLLPFGWYWDSPASTPYRFAWITPASSLFRSLFVTRVAAAMNALHADALHLDVSGPMFNDGNGAIDGLTFPQGSVQLHKDLLAAFPGVVLGGEGENDILYPYEFFAQSWGVDTDPGQPGHPIMSFLFGGHIQYYGHLGQPEASDPAFKLYLNDLETRAVVPQLPLFGTADLDLTDPDNARLFAILQNFQHYSLQPDWTATAGGAQINYQGINGTSGKFVDSANVATLTAGSATVYQQAHDAAQLVTGAFALNWPAFDSTTLYGLDPTNRYWLNAVARPGTTHLPSLPPGVQLGTRTLIAPGFAHVEVVPPPAAPPFDFVGNFFSTKTGVGFLGVDFPLANGALVQETSMTAGGVTRQGIVTHPPYLAQIGGEAFVEFPVPVPAGATLQFSVAMDDNDACTDGVTLRITANGSEIWQRAIQPGGWQDASVSLSSYAGSTIALRLLSNPGPAKNTGCDRSAWSGLQLMTDPVAVTANLTLALAGGSVYSGFTGNGSISATDTATPVISSVPLPGQFTVFTKPGQPVTAGMNLAALPFEIWKSGVNDLPQPGAVFSAGTIDTAIVGGVIKSGSIFGHPPNNGFAIFSWVVNLPAAGLQLGWNAGIDDDAPTDDGVQFLVYVNGVQAWSWTTRDHFWEPGSIDLSAWKGQNVLLQFVTYSLANNTWDHAEWADLLFGPAGVSGGAAPALQASNNHAGSFTQGQPGAAYTVMVSNSTSATSTNGIVTVTDMIPEGLTLVSMAGYNWQCSANSCSRSDALVAGAAYPPITVTVNVAPAAPPQVTNQVIVAGGGSVNATATDTTPITPFTCDLNGDQATNAKDVQAIVTAALAGAGAADDLNHDGAVNILDAQKLVNAALGFGCVY